MKEKDKIDLSKKINDKIKVDDVKMKSRWFFVAEKLGIESGVLLFLLVGIVLISFSLYVMQQNGAFEFVEFGPRGWPVIFNNIPYDLIIIAIVFFVLASFLVKYFDFTYKQPFYLFSCGVLLLIAGIISALTMTGASQAMFDKAANAKFVKKIYNNKITNMPKSPNALVGKVIAANGNVITLQTPQGKLINVKVNNVIQRPINTVYIERGQVIKIMGRNEGEEFKAELIRLFQNKKFNQIHPYSTETK